MNETEKQRLDQWLFFARIIKSRTLAATLISGGKVRVNRQKIDKPAFLIKSGDQLTMALPNKIFVCKIIKIGKRRGPAPEAQKLYENITPALELQERLPYPTIIPGAKPSKKERKDALALTRSFE